MRQVRKIAKVTTAPPPAAATAVPAEQVLLDSLLNDPIDDITPEFVSPLAVLFKAAGKKKGGARTPLDKLRISTHKRIESLTHFYRESVQMGRLIKDIPRRGAYLLKVSFAQN